MKGFQKGDFYFTFSTGVLQATSLEEDGGIEGTTLKGKKVTISPTDKGFAFLKDFDPSLSVPVPLLSSENIREELQKLSSSKAKPKNRIKSKVQKEKDKEEILRQMLEDL